VGDPREAARLDERGQPGQQCSADMATSWTTLTPSLVAWLLAGVAAPPHLVPDRLRRAFTSPPVGRTCSSGHHDEERASSRYDEVVGSAPSCVRQPSSDPSLSTTSPPWKGEVHVHGRGVRGSEDDLPGDPTLSLSSPGISEVIPGSVKTFCACPFQLGCSIQAGFLTRSTRQRLSMTLEQQGCVLSNRWQVVLVSLGNES